MIELRCRPPYDPWTCSGCGQGVEDRAPSSVLAGTVCDGCLDAGRFGEPFVPLTVRPTPPRREPKEVLIVAVSMQDQMCATEHGETFTLAELVERIRERKPGERGRNRYEALPDRLPPATIICDNPLDLLGFLDASKCADSEFWQWSVNIRAQQTPWRPEARGKARRIYLTPKPARFGFPSRGADGARKKDSRWWTLLDPTAFFGDESPVHLADLLGFGIDLREWADTHSLPMLTSISAYGSRLLRDSRFGTSWRRKVPTSTNARLRLALPGNHYQLVGKPGLTYRTAHKWDQAGAHHSAAFVTAFPNANRLDCRGWFRRPSPLNGSPVKHRGAIHAKTAQWAELLTHRGMYTLAIRSPKRVAQDPFSIPALRHEGFTWQTVTSVELDHIRARRDDGVMVGDIFCAWTSPTEDDRLREYADWSVRELEHADPKIKRWLKPMLLSSYGMLAVRPAKFRNAWRWCMRPEGAVGWQTRYGTLIGLERSTQSERESQTANVLWRALIESQVRLASLEAGRRLRAAQVRPIAIYADAVFAIGNPKHLAAVSLPPPWRYEGQIHNLSFETPARYRSDEETRLPGTPSGSRELVNPRT